MQVLLVWDEASSDFVIIRVTEINYDMYQCMMSLNNIFYLMGVLMLDVIIEEVLVIQSRIKDIKYLTFV